MGATNARSICATIVGGVFAWNVALEPAHAQFTVWPQVRSWWGNYVPSRHKHHYHKYAKPRSTKKAPAQHIAKGPLHLVVSIADQQISVYDDGALITRSPVSTGTPEHPTPFGIFSVISKHRWHRSNLYSNAQMPYMQRLTWSGIALHQGVLPGYPASHGCIRLETDLAVRLWHLTKRGTRVIIAPHDVRPVEVANSRLPQIGSRTKSVIQKTTAMISENTMVEVPAAPFLFTSGDVSSVQPVTAQHPNAARKKGPISVLVSRKSGKLFVRHGFTYLFEAPVTIQNPQEFAGNASLHPDARAV